jgi:hypothetical protein
MFNQNISSNKFDLNLSTTLSSYPLMHLWVEPAGGEWKSADIEQKMVTLIYPYPILLGGSNIRG